MPRFRSALGAVLAAAALGVVTACGGALGTTTGAGVPSQPGKTTAAQQGDTSPRKIVEARRGDTEQSEPSATRTKTPTPTPTPQVTLSPLPQPTTVFPEPEKPEAPKKSADELDQIIYTLETVAWDAAGEADEDTKTKCTIDEDDLVRIGTHNFDCTVKFRGVAIEFAVTAKITSDEIRLSYRTNYLPLSEEKAVYEASRQAYKPARVTCDIEGVEVVRVGKDDGFVCWVTDVENNRVTYHGQMLRDGELVLVPKK